MTWFPLALTLFACGGEEAAAPAEEAPAAEAPAAEEPAKEEAAAEEAPSEGEAKVFFIEPKDGATVKSPVKIRMGLAGMAVKPAGTMEEGTGHHHIIIGPAGVEKGTVIPADETHIHFGLGQTEAEVELAPGAHKITMQFADGAHQSYGDVMAHTITINVEE